MKAEQQSVQCRVIPLTCIWQISYKKNGPTKICNMLAKHAGLKPLDLDLFISDL